ncbi:MAG: transposase [Desulfuromonadales bacterium]|nr:transposase [Desulfuromonadales bacterium]
MLSREDVSVYHPRQPQQSTLWKLLDAHYATFERDYEQTFRKGYGYRRAVVAYVVRDYLKCGDLREGFARVRCPDCCHEYLLTFSCKGRWFCSSCHAKKVVQFGDLLGSTILSPLPHRQYVFTLPKILRVYFRYDRKLLTKLCQCANRCLHRYFKAALNAKTSQLGTVTAIQIFGDYGRWHPHLHLLVADGLFMPNGSFHVMPDLGLKPLQELFRDAVLKKLKREGKIDDEFIRMLVQWRHVSGFNIHNGVKIDRRDNNGREALAQYIIRSSFALEKMQYIEDSGTVIYRSKMGHGKNKRNFEIFSTEEFIARITQHIPEKSFQLVRYYGWYSNRARGDSKKKTAKDSTDITSAATEVLILTEPPQKKIPSKTWRECIKKVWEVDPLACPKCGGEMKLVSFIDEPLLVRRILEHLDLWQECLPKGLPPPQHHEDMVEGVSAKRLTTGGVVTTKQGARCTDGRRGHVLDTCPRQR